MGGEALRTALASQTQPYFRQLLVMLSRDGTLIERKTDGTIEWAVSEILPEMTG